MMDSRGYIYTCIDCNLAVEDMNYNDSFEEWMDG